ncbi:hypothetical protein MWN34_05715 [Ancylobacter sp. 6x-1]|uniref:Uncharacterized protein n=1 Tax=Ancylobacter crimeensis TaxID=2579147 RepID=A0ABT0D8X9_9HYPH|nr:hypothetical protein [Ancylobacter crimeensis]MCK0196408.1 hypothetical protein [Ancylobacter crimeensis]
MKTTLIALLTLAALGATAVQAKGPSPDQRKAWRATALSGSHPGSDIVKPKKPAMK